MTVVTVKRTGELSGLDIHIWGVGRGQDLDKVCSRNAERRARALQDGVRAL